MSHPITTCSRLCLAVGILSLVGCGGGHGTELKVNGAQLFYTSAVDRAQAEKLGGYLVKEGFFDGKLITVQLDRKDMIWLFRLVASDERQAQSPKNVERFRNFARKLTNEAFDGQSVVIHLCDKNLKTIAVADPADSVGVDPVLKF